jgi:hypothetical protein
MYFPPHINFINEGKITKKLKFQAMPNESGYFLSIQVNDKVNPVTLSLPVTLGEMEILTTVFRYCIPGLLGFDLAFRPVNILNAVSNVNENKYSTY